MATRLFSLPRLAVGGLFFTFSQFPDADITRVLQMYVPGLYVAPKDGPFGMVNGGE
ncbi:hypothetical protein [Brenneria roseae]|uniref:hypothetical protein n=1 Tax=Brenneria roseae TaxID=1509241 RepID=UPI0014488B8A|nr:hypothetical protein [Brenneria roseae]